MEVYGVWLLQIDLRVPILFYYWCWTVQDCMRLYRLCNLFMLNHISHLIFSDYFMKAVLLFFGFDVGLMEWSHILTDFFLFFHFLHGYYDFSLFLKDFHLFLLVRLSAL
jgi:hypothetical protein